MKLLNTLFFMAFVSFLMAGNGPTTDKSVNTSTSKLTWKANKVVGSHEGVITLKKGTLKFDGKNLTGGSFVIDMTTIDCTDLSGGTKDKLVGHLKSDDFFGVAKFAESTFNITQVKTTKPGSYSITGDLTLKGITDEITFDAVVVGNTATATIKVDRTKYDIKYGSGSFFSDLGDKAIKNEFDLNIALNF